MIACPQCGYDNELGRIFCHSCGTKLDLSKIKPPSEGAKMRRRVKRNAAKAVRMGIELVIVGIIGLCIFLLCLTPDLAPNKATTEELSAADTKRTDLESLGSGLGAGKVVVTDTELNTYVNSFTFEKPTGQGLEVTPIALRCNVKNGVARIEFLGTIHYSNTLQKNMYLAYEGVPKIVDGRFVFAPTGGWFGKLPIHPALLVNTPFFENYVGQLLKNMADDKKLLEKLSSITVTSNTVEFVKNALPTAPAATTSPAAPVAPATAH